LQGWINSILKNQDKITLFVETHKHLIKMIVEFAAIAAALAPIIAGLALIVLTVGILLSPITLVVAGIAAISAAVAALYIKFKWFRDLVMVVWNIVKLLANVLAFGFKQAIYTLKIIGEIMDFVFIKPIEKAIALFKKFTSFLDAHAAKNKGGLLGGQQPNRKYEGGLLGDLFKSFNPQPNTINSNISIGLNDPGGMVKSVGAKSDGKVAFDLGANMASARY
jgi:hypothetical protein